MQCPPLTSFFSIKKITFLVFGLFLLSACTLLPRDYVSHTINSNSLIIDSKQGQVTYKALAGDAIEVLYGSDIKQLPSFSQQEVLTKKNFNKKNINQVVANISESASAFTFTNGELTLIINKGDLSASFYSNNKLLTTQSSFVNLPKKKGFTFILDDTEKLLGGGERVLGMDRRGHRMPLYNKAHYGYTTESNQMNFGLPMVMSDKKYAVLFDNSASGFLDIGKTEKNTLSFEAVGGRTSYIVFTGSTYPKLINNYVDVTGKQPLPPRWALGNFSSRFGYKSEQEVRNTVDKFALEDFPLDTIILDLYWFGPDIKGHMGNLDWDTNAFPSPVKMIKDLQEKNINTILITEPFILNSSKKWDEAVQKNILAKNAEGKPYEYDFYFGRTGLIDIFNDKAIDWLSDIYTGLFNQGVAGTWGDLGEPEVHPDDIVHYLSATQQYASGAEIHNVYGHEWANVVYNTQRKLQPNSRPFLLMRSGFAGSQRYGMFPWTGDVSRSWDGLKPQVELSLQMGMMGMAYTHSDLGGFAGGETFDQEMYIRWLQYGAFQPIYRPHGQDNIAPEPVFHNKLTKRITQKYIKLRYAMLPYIYTMAYQNTTTGLPLMRPLFFADENNKALFDNKTAYFWGDAFLVSPVTDANQTEQKVTLPKGVWFDFWTDTRYENNFNVNAPSTTPVVNQTTIPVSIENIPVLVKAGAFVPMIKPVNNTTDYSSKQLTVHYYADASVLQSSGIMYEDDGVTYGAIKNKNYDLLHFSATNLLTEFTTNSVVSLTGTLGFEFEREGNGYANMPESREVELVIHNIGNNVKRITVDDIVLPETAYVYNIKESLLTVTFDWANNKSSLKITN